MARAKIYGLEFELRKNLSFINPDKILSSITAYGNLTLQKSSVIGSDKISNPNPKEPDIKVDVKQDSPMYGQAPYLVNAGLQYTGEHFGFNIAYNKSGNKGYCSDS